MARKDYIKNESDRALIQAMVRLNSRIEQIAAAVGVTVPTLKKYYPDELARLETKYVPNDEDRMVVWRMIAFGFTLAQTAKRLRMSIELLKEHYQDVIDSAHEEAIDQVATNLVRIATGNQPQSANAAMFYLRCRARWNDRETVEKVDSEALAQELRSALDEIDASTVGGEPNAD